MNSHEIPRADDIVEMAETMALFRTGFDALTRHAALHALSDVDSVAAHVAEDQDFAAAWQRASFSARSEALATIASVTAWAGATLDGATPPDSPARVLLTHARQARRAPRPDVGSPPFGPLTGPAAAYAAELVGDPALDDRAQRVVFAVLGLHAMSATMPDPS